MTIQIFTYQTEETTSNSRREQFCLNFYNQNVIQY